MMIEILIFVLFQGMAVNGVYMSMQDGMILSGYKAWLKKQKSWLAKPMGLCVMCSASVGGTLTFWPVAVYAFGFKPIEIFAWVIDIFVLVYVNFFLYKKV